MTRRYQLTALAALALFSGVVVFLGAVAVLRNPRSANTSKQEFSLEKGTLELKAVGDQNAPDGIYKAGTLSGRAYLCQKDSHGTSVLSCISCKVSKDLPLQADETWGFAFEFQPMYSTAKYKARTTAKTLFVNCKRIPKEADGMATDEIYEFSTHGICRISGQIKGNEVFIDRFELITE